MKACSSQSRQSAKLFSSRRNWDSPNPSPAGENATPPPLWFRGEGHTRWRVRGWESLNSDEGTYTLVLCQYMYFVMQLYTVYSEGPWRRSIRRWPWCRSPPGTVRWGWRRWAPAGPACSLSGRGSGVRCSGPCQQGGGYNQFNSNTCKRECVTRWILFLKV